MSSCLLPALPLEHSRSLGAAKGQGRGGGKGQRGLCRIRLPEGSPRARGNAGGEAGVGSQGPLLFVVGVSSVQPSTSQFAAGLPLLLLSNTLNCEEMAGPHEKRGETWQGPGCHSSGGDHRIPKPQERHWVSARAGRASKGGCPAAVFAAAANSLCRDRIWVTT